MYYPRGGAFAIFLHPHRVEFGSLSVPNPREFAIQKKKNANAWGGEGCSWNLLMHKLDRYE